MSLSKIHLSRSSKIRSSPTIRSRRLIPDPSPLFQIKQERAQLLHSFSRQGIHGPQLRKAGSQQQPPSGSMPHLLREDFLARRSDLAVLGFPRVSDNVGQVLGQRLPVHVIESRHVLEGPRHCRLGGGCVDIARKDGVVNGAQIGVSGRALNGEGMKAHLWIVWVHRGDGLGRGDDPERYKVQQEFPRVLIPKGPRVTYPRGLVENARGLELAPQHFLALVVDPKDVNGAVG